MSDAKRRAPDSVLQQCRTLLRRVCTRRTDDSIIQLLTKCIDSLETQHGLAPETGSPAAFDPVDHSLDLGLGNHLFLLASLHLEVAKLRTKRGELEEAGRLCARCLQYFPRYIAAMAELAQVRRIEACSEEALQQVEAVLQDAVRAGQVLAAAEGGLVASCNKECKREVQAAAAARECLALLLCQRAADDAAAEQLHALGYTHRLAQQVLHYPLPSHPPPASTPGPHPTAATTASDGFTCAFDSAVPAGLLRHLQAAFAPGAPFWQEHNYGRIGYFSYLHPLDASTTNPPSTSEPQSAATTAATTNSILQLAFHLRALLLPAFPRLAKARHMEFWAHCRPHCHGHQLHFDSDDEGQGGVRNPIISTVLFLSGGVGGPTLVTDQELTGQLATKGWLVHPVEGRVAAFAGQYLHGVLPGRGPAPSPTARRSTLMLAFWEDVQMRPDPDHKPGPCRPFPRPAPHSPYSWPAQLEAPAGGPAPGCDQGAAPAQGAALDSEQGGCQPVPAPVIPVSCVWEPVVLAGEGAAAAKVPTYDSCFQGF